MSITINGNKYNKFTEIINDAKFRNKYLSSNYVANRTETIKNFRSFMKNKIDKSFTKDLWIKEKISGLPSCKQVRFGGDDVYENNKSKLNRIIDLVAHEGNTESNYVNCLSILEKLKDNKNIHRIPYVLLNRIFIGFYPDEHIDWVSISDLKNIQKHLIKLDDFIIDFESANKGGKWFLISQTIRDKANKLGKGHDANYISFVIFQIIENLKKISSINEKNDEELYPEGKANYKLHLSKERSGKATKKLKKDTLNSTGKLECEVCTIDFYQRYGDLGLGFIEAHHTFPVSKMKKDHKTKISELALVCSNCHRMLHRAKNLLTIKELKDIYNGNRIK